MKKGAKRFLILSSILFSIIFLITIISGLEPDYARITDVDYVATVVDDSGKVHIKERLTFDVHASDRSNPFWELWRELPEAYYDGVMVNYNVLSVKEILSDGTEIIMPESSKLYWYDEDFTDDSGLYGPGKWYHSEGPYDDYYYYESLIFYVDGLYRETVTYEIEYEMFNASLRYADASELYLAMYSGPTSKYLNSFNGSIRIPLDKMPQDSNYSAYTYGTDSHEFGLKTSEDLEYFTFSFNLNKDDLKFHDYNEYIEFALITYNEDKHIFTEDAAINHYYYDDMLSEINHQQEVYEALPATFHKHKITLLNTFSILGLLVLSITFFGERSYKRKKQLFEPSQKIDYYRDIPSDADPNFIRQLVFNDNKDSVGEDGFASVLLSLIHKKIVELEIKDPNKKQIPSNTLIKVNPDGQAVSPIEKQYLDLIYRHTKDDQITLKELQDKIEQDYSYTDAFVKRVDSSIKQYGVVNNYYQKLRYKAPKENMNGLGIFFLILGILFTIIANVLIYESRLDLAFGAFFIFGFAIIISGIYLMIASKKYILFTQFGVDEKEKWQALYRFLNNETLMVERGVQDIVIWEKYLIYATAFGISHKVIKAFKMKFPREIVESSIVYYNTRMTRSNMFNNYARSLSTSTRTASYTSRSGGHGGYGGGGRGGGGGGGGH